MEPYFILSRIRIPTVRLKSSIQNTYCPIIRKKRRDEMSRHASDDYLMNNAVEKKLFSLLLLTKENLSPLEHKLNASFD